MAFGNLLAASTCLYFAISFTAMAQTVDPNIVLEVRQCQGSQCQTAALDAVQALRKQGLSEEEFNSQLGTLAAVIFQRARDAGTQEASQEAARAIAVLAEYSSDLDQRRSFLEIAEALRAGTANDLDLAQPFAVSPSGNGPRAGIRQPPFRSNFGRRIRETRRSDAAQSQ